MVGTVNQLDSKGDLVPVENGPESEHPCPSSGRRPYDLTLDVNWSDVNGFDDTGAPQINRRSFATDLRVALGDEIVIGGIKRETAMKVANKVPILGSLPLIGYAFGGQQTQNQKREVVIVIKPLSVMDYKVATDYGVSVGRQHGHRQSGGVAKPSSRPALKAGFDQLGLDPEYGFKAAPGE